VGAVPYMPLIVIFHQHKKASDVTCILLLRQQSKVKPNQHCLHSVQIDQYLKRALVQHKPQSILKLRNIHLSFWIGGGFCTLL
jgi:hypothetical protein